MTDSAHWQQVYQTRPIDATSWYQPRAEPSLSLIRDACPAPDAAIVDVGGGASTLIDGLLGSGYTDLTVLDIAAASLEQARARLGDAATRVDWQVGDVTRHTWPHRRFDLWHDRAVFHFLTGHRERDAYIERLHQALDVNGHLVIATFADDGPAQCSGLDVQRYDETTLAETLGPGLRCLSTRREHHRTPAGRTQSFLYGVFRKAD